jgi:hypothetical protein
MSSTTPIDFILDNFDTTITMDLCGNFAGILESMTASAEAIIQIDLNSAKLAFQFQTDASDVVNDNPNDVKFYLNATKFWDACFNLNPADAEVQNVGPTATITTGPIATGYDANKSKVCHDFVRFLALGLFNTHHGVDLFDNEQQLLENIRKEAADVWTTMNNELLKYNEASGTGDGVILETDSAGLKYSTFVHADSITKKLYEQMIYTLGGKKRFISGDGMISNSGVKQALPFQEYDTISLKLIINPEADQENLTGVADFGSRSYRIKYVLKNSPNNVPRANDELNTYLVRPEI